MCLSTGRRPLRGLECPLSRVFRLPSALGSDTTPLPSWAALHSSTWGSLKQALKGLSVEFALLADKAAQQGKKEEKDRDDGGYRRDWPLNARREDRGQK